MDASLAYWLIPLVILAMFLLMGVHSAHRERFGREGFGNTERREGFENEEEADGETETHEDYDQIYDEFYANVYDKLFTTPERV